MSLAFPPLATVQIVLIAGSTYLQGYEKFGFNVRDNGDIVYREWAPNVVDAHLIGDFSEWEFHTGRSSGEWRTEGRGYGVCFLVGYIMVNS